jgi:hypothetical protein
VGEHGSVPGIRRNRPPRDTPGGGLPQPGRRNPHEMRIRPLRELAAEIRREVRAREGFDAGKGRGGGAEPPDSAGYRQGGASLPA